MAGNGAATRTAGACLGADLRDVGDDTAGGHGEAEEEMALANEGETGNGIPWMNRDTDGEEASDSGLRRRPRGLTPDPSGSGRPTQPQDDLAASPSAAMAPAIPGRVTPPPQCDATYPAGPPPLPRTRQALAALRALDRRADPDRASAQQASDLGQRDAHGATAHALQLIDLWHMDDDGTDDDAIDFSAVLNENRASSLPALSSADLRKIAQQPTSPGRPIAMSVKQEALRVGDEPSPSPDASGGPPPAIGSALPPIPTAGGPASQFPDTQARQPRTSPPGDPAVRPGEGRARRPSSAAPPPIPLAARAAARATPSGVRQSALARHPEFTLDCSPPPVVRSLWPRPPSPGGIPIPRRALGSLPPPPSHVARRASMGPQAATGRPADGGGSPRRRRRWKVAAAVAILALGAGAALTAMAGEGRASDGIGDQITDAVSSAERTNGPTDVSARAGTRDPRPSRVIDLRNRLAAPMQNGDAEDNAPVAPLSDHGTPQDALDGNAMGVGPGSDRLGNDRRGDDGEIPTDSSQGTIPLEEISVRAGTTALDDDANGATNDDATRSPAPQWEIGDSFDGIGSEPTFTAPDGMTPWDGVASGVGAGSEAGGLDRVRGSRGNGETAVEAAPEILAGAPAMAELPSRRDVVAAIEALRDDLIGCAGSRHGPVDLRLSIAGSGRTTSARVTGSFAGTAAGSCMARVARGLTVPTFAAQRLEVSYPLYL